MSRRHSAEKREVQPDAKYGDIVLTKFMNSLMYDGKKSAAEEIVYGALEMIEKKTKNDALKVFRDALDNVKPAIEVRSRRVGGATYQVPVEVRPDRRQALAIRWIIDHARSRSEKTMTDRLSAELLDAAGVKKHLPFLNFTNNRFPIQGGLRQARGGTVRHDAVAWGYARGADAQGVDIIQNCEVTGIRTEKGRAVGIETTRGYIGAKKIGLACAGNSSRVASMAGLNLPIESHVLQAFVSEGIKPFIDTVVTFGAGHFYISQSDKGGLVFGGDLDGYNSYAQRGNLPTIEDVCEGGMALMPAIGRLRLLRHWGGIMDMSMDGSPIIDKTPIDGLYLNAGWCYGGFKATPASGFCFAHLLAKDEMHSVGTAYRLDRFATGHTIDEKGVGAQPNLH